MTPAPIVTIPVMAIAPVIAVEAHAEACGIVVGVRFVPAIAIAVADRARFRGRRGRGDGADPEQSGHGAGGHKFANGHGLTLSMLTPSPGERTGCPAPSSGKPCWKP